MLNFRKKVMLEQLLDKRERILIELNHIKLVKLGKDMLNMVQSYNSSLNVDVSYLL